MRHLGTCWGLIVAALLVSSAACPAEEAPLETVKEPVPLKVVPDAPDPNNLSLEDCRSLAILGNIGLKRSMIENRRSELTLWNDEGLYLPNLSLSFGHSHDSDSQDVSLSLSGTGPLGTSVSVSAGHGWDASSGDSDVTVSVTQPLLEGATRIERLDTLWKSRISAAIQRNLLEKEIENVLYTAHSKYIECIKQELTIKVNNRSLLRTMRLYEVTREKELLGAATVLDLAEVESTLASRKIALAESQRAHKAALDDLKKFLDIDVDTEVKLAPVDIDLEESETDDSSTRIAVDEKAFTVALRTARKDTGELLGEQVLFRGTQVDASELMSRAISNRLDLANAQLSQARAYLTCAADRIGLRPDLDLSLSYTKSGYGATSGESLPLDEESWSIGLSFSVPIGNRGDRASYEKALLDYQSARLTVRETEQKVRGEVRSMLRELDTACMNVLNYALQVRSAGLGLESTRAVYDLGDADFFRVLDAENTFLTAQRNYIRTYLDYELLLSELKLVAGEDSGRLGELVIRGRELSDQMKQASKPRAPEDSIKKLYLKTTPADQPFRPNPKITLNSAE
ncbi:MAG: TolC family protein [Planctomycetes bacterium]|nr:TolC family protein [Planctomycetota bacterium]